MKNRLFVILIGLLLFTSACGPSNTTKNSSQATATLQPSQTQTETQIPPTSTPTPVPPTPTPTINPQPVSIEEGLASLNSYTLNITVKASSDTNPKISFTVIVEKQHTTDPDASFTHINISGSTGIAKSAGNDDMVIYTIGNDQCTGVKSGDASEADWSFAGISANLTDMITAMWNMISITPVITDPKLVGEETVNNIPTDHYTFTVPGLAAKSGAEITANQGDYWLAKDGRYIVKGNMVTETRGAENSQIIHYEGNLELTDINQPISITLPKACIDIKNKTQTPTP